MTTTELRRDLKKRIDKLGDDRLRSAADYLAFLEEASNPVASAMRKRLKKAEADVENGRLTPVSALRRKY